MVYIYVSSHFVAKIHINHIKVLAGVFYIIENTNCVLVNCDVLICEANGNSSSLSFSSVKVAIFHGYHLEHLCGLRKSSSERQKVANNSVSANQKAR